jgi:hypothetical protein
VLAESFHFRSSFIENKIEKKEKKKKKQKKNLHMTDEDADVYGDGCQEGDGIFGSVDGDKDDEPEGGGAGAIDPIAYRRQQQRQLKHSAEVMAVLERCYGKDDNMPRLASWSASPREPVLRRSRSSPLMCRIRDPGLGIDTGPLSPSIDSDQPKSGSITPVTTPRAREFAVVFK